MYIYIDKLYMTRRIKLLGIIISTSNFVFFVLKGVYCNCLYDIVTVVVVFFLYNKNK